MTEYDNDYSTEDDSNSNFYKVVDIKVVDGDTLDLKLDLGFSTIVEKRVSLHNLDAPEVFGIYASQEGRDAKAFVEQWIAKNQQDNVVFWWNPASWSTPEVGVLYALPTDSDDYASLNESILEKGYAILENPKDEETS
jgi:endonuclease YncB( thermonuclease family)